MIYQIRESGIIFTAAKKLHFLISFSGLCSGWGNSLYYMEMSRPKKTFTGPLLGESIGQCRILLTKGQYGELWYFPEVSWKKHLIIQWCFQWFEMLSHVCYATVITILSKHHAHILHFFVIWLIADVVTQKDMGNVHQHQTTTRHNKAWTICKIFWMGCMLKQVLDMWKVASVVHVWRRFSAGFHKIINHIHKIAYRSLFNYRLTEETLFVTNALSWCFVYSGVPLLDILNQS